MPPGKFTPGFRCSPIDVIVLVIGTIASIGSAMVVWSWGFVIAFVVFHFFLFCNIVRIARPLELIWAGAFLALAIPTIVIDRPGWPATFVLSLIATLAVVVVEMRKPSYHGVGWQRINPNLPAWWESH